MKKYTVVMRDGHELDDDDVHINHIESESDPWTAAKAERVRLIAECPAITDLIIIAVFDGHIVEAV